MSNITEEINRVCPFCKHKYIQKIYTSNRGRGSICPNCRKRSDRARARAVSRSKSRKESICILCKIPFYGWKPKQKFCSKECRIFYMNNIEKKTLMWRRRQIGIRQLKNFGYFIERIEKNPGVIV